MADGERHSPKYVTRSRKIKSINKKRMGLTDDNGVEMITTEASIYIRSMYGDLNTNIIEIKRPEGLVSVIPSPPSMDVTANVLGATRRLIHGVLGMINLSCGPVLIVATEIKLVTDNFLNRKHKVYNIVDVDIVPIWMHSLKNSLHSPSQITDDIEYVKLLRMAVTEGGVCFSKTFDLTRSLQNQTFEVNPDANFMFNGHAATPFLTVLSRNEQKAKNLIIGIGALILVAIEGLVEWNNGLSIGGDTLFSLGLVARRRIGRDGKKCFSRGIDDQGEVSNAVESEQILADENNDSPMRITSFVQFRGSIPIFWRHHLDLRYKPRMEIQQRSETFNVLLKHFKTLESHYGGKITAVNLVHSTGWEGRLANVYNDLSQRLEKNNFSYVAFDFHHNCRSMRWDRIDWLISNLSTDIQDQSYFLSVSVPGAADYKIVKTQKGVIRTNCIDCLDRTNVVQSFIAKKVLEIQLCEMFGGTEGCIKNNPLLVYRLNNMWADHGDSVSSHYAGTGAMKTDFTRNGVRTIFGILDDGKKGLLRYIYTHFHDGIAQDALDLFLGKYTVSNSLKSGERNNSPFLMGSSLLFHKKPNWRLLAAPMILVMSLAILIFSMIERSLGSLKLSMLISAILLASIMIMNERSMYVVLPRLVPVPRIKPSKSYLGIPIVRYLKRKFAPKRHLI